MFHKWGDTGACRSMGWGKGEGRWRKRHSLSCDCAGVRMEGEGDIVQLPAVRSYQCKQREMVPLISDHGPWCKINLLSIYYHFICEVEWQRENNPLLVLIPFPKAYNTVRAGPGRSQNLHQVSCTGGRDPDTWVSLTAVRLYISRMRDWKQSIWDLWGRCSDVGCVPAKQVSTAVPAICACLHACLLAFFFLPHDS